MKERFLSYSQELEVNYILGRIMLSPIKPFCHLAKKAKQSLKYSKLFMEN